MEFQFLIFRSLGVLSPGHVAMGHGHSQRRQQQQQQQQQQRWWSASASHKAPSLTHCTTELVVHVEAAVCWIGWGPLDICAAHTGGSAAQGNSKLAEAIPTAVRARHRRGVAGGSHGPGGDDDE